jgi:hypothetical protein
VSGTGRTQAAGGLEFVLVDGGWTENPHLGDRDFYAAEERRLWGELGELLGIGPPPDDFFDEHGDAWLLPRRRRECCVK